MKENLSARVERYLNSRHEKKRRMNVLRVLALIVVFVTVYALIMPAVTLSNEVTCGMEAHVHDESCWEVLLSSPQPELVCQAQASGVILLHTHDPAYCYNEAGELICTIPERQFHIHIEGVCYQEQRELICQDIQDLGHTHTAACYAYDRSELLTCGLEESAGHVHTDACYPQERTSEPQCGLAGDASHTHTEACYMVPVKQRLICTIPEGEDVYEDVYIPAVYSEAVYDENGEVVDEGGELLEEAQVIENGRLVQEGHRHDSNCYAAAEYVCGQQEVQGHVHTEDCRGWEQRLTCMEEERPAGHIHTDECYQITQMLACQLPETVVHTHAESCYGPDGQLICGKKEVVEHQHGPECLFTPEGEAEEVRTLTCGMTEHVHTEDCYVELIPKDDVTYYCGYIEHMHSGDCYFESGQLCCTLPEHLHTAVCLDPEQPEESEEPEESGPSQPQVIELNESYTYKMPEFDVTFHVSGCATVKPDPTGGVSVSDIINGGYTGVSNGGGVTDAAPWETAPSVYPPAQPDEQPGAGEPADAFQQSAARDVFDSGVSASALSYGNDSGEGDQTAVTEPSAEDYNNDASAVPAAPEASAPQTEGEDGAMPPVDGTSGSQPDESGAHDRVPEINGGLGGDVSDFEVSFHVEEQDADVWSGSGAQDEDRETLLKKILTLTASVDGRELELDQCDVTIEVAPTKELLLALEQMTQVLAISDHEDERLEGNELVMSILAGEEVLASASLTAPLSDGSANAAAPSYSADPAAGGAPALTSELPDDTNCVGITVSSLVNPTYTVEYYAYLKTVDRSSSGTLDVIDTSGGLLPQNGVTPNTTKMTLEADGSVKMEQGVQPLFRTHKYNYVTAPGLQYVDIIRNQVLEGTAQQTALTNYQLKEIWVRVDDASKVVSDGNGFAMVETITKRDDAGNTGTENVTYRVEREIGEDGAVYFWKVFSCDNNLYFTNNEATAKKDANAIWIRNGAAVRLVYDTTSGVTQNPAALYDYDISGGPNTADTVATKNNGINNYEGSGAHYAFGNKNTGTDFGEETWNGNKLNMTNKANSYAGCTFGLVKGMSGTSDNRTVVFSDGVAGPDLFSAENVEGAKTVYPNSRLTFNRVGDTYTLTGLSGEGVSTLTGLDRFTHPAEKYTNIWTNSFWPMDAAKNTDPQFGKEGKEVKGSSGYLPASDDFKNHNSYFGMSFAVEFELSADYIGPLEYCFFGDDDMWVFLTDVESGSPQLICDIGGVHSSVGEYVNLWDYVEKDDRVIDVTKGENEGNATTKKYRLDFFYTERGASGSTCWMQFTLPTLAGVNLETEITEKVNENQGALWIEKLVPDAASDDEFEFELTLTDKDGQPLTRDIYSAKTYRRSDSDANDPLTPVESENDEYMSGKLNFKLKSGEVLVITGLPVGARYVVEEVGAKQAADSGMAPKDWLTQNYETSVWGCETKVAAKTKDLPETEGAPEADAPLPAGESESWEALVTLDDRKAAGTIDSSTIDKIRYVNTPASTLHGDPGTGSLRVEKILKGVNSAESFMFDVTLDFSKVSAEDREDYGLAGEEYRPSVYVDGGTGSVLVNDIYFRATADGCFQLYYGTAENGAFGLGLSHGQSLRIDGLPPGTVYTVVERDALGYTASYTKEVEKFVTGADTEDGGVSEQAGGSGIQDGAPDSSTDGIREAGPVNTGEIGEDQIDKVTCVNTPNYTLPETGGAGAYWYTWVGVLLLAAGCLWYKKKSCEKGAAD